VPALVKQMKGVIQKMNQKSNKGITLIALVITIIVHCDKAIKYSNNNGFLLSSI